MKARSIHGKFAAEIISLLDKSMDEGTCRPDIPATLCSRVSFKEN